MAPAQDPVEELQALIARLSESLRVLRLQQADADVAATLRGRELRRTPYHWDEVSIEYPQADRRQHPRR